MRARLLVAALASAFLASAAPAWAGDPIMPLSQLRSGMQCTGYSVIRGTEITSFAVEILDVVSGDASADDGPRILVRVSGPAVDETGIGPGFSGSPIYCTDGDGTARNAGAISESIGEFGGKVVLATPIEEILGNPPDAPAAKPVPARASRARQLVSPLTVSGLSQPLAQALARAGQKAGRPVLAAPAAPLTPFPISPPRPGSAMSAGYSTGDLSVGAVGTVAYVDGDRVWGFGHPFENGGGRSLLLQDAYVYRVINNPNSGGDQGSTYKLAAVGHPLGTISNDASAAVVGRTGAQPPTVPVRIFSTDLDTGEQRTLGTRVVDETGVGTPTGGSALSFIAPLAVAQGASAILRSAPGKLTGTMCARIALRERRTPLRFCNRYVSGVAPPEDGGATNVVAAGAAADVLQALSLLDEFKLSGLHVTEFAARVKLRRGQRQAFMRSASLPRRVRPGQRVRARLRLRVVRGRRLTRSFTLRIPSLRPGRHRLTFSGTDVDNPDSEFFGALVSTITIGDEEAEAPTGDPGPGSVEELADQVRAIARFDGVSVRVGGRRDAGDPAYLDPEVRISGRVSTTVRVVRKRRTR